MFGIEIPRFCYHDRLSIAGNCRMCLVAVKGSPKPVASCAMPIADKMEISTNTEQVKSMREGVMRFLLANHPLDCPICDQGGECDLQDQAMLYGKGYSEFSDYKRAVEYKYFGHLVETTMTRCIHCTRCIRFMEEVAGTNELGMVNRGNSAEVVCVSPTGLHSELSGNIIDICPVGALTSKPYAFKARPWELQHYDTIDAMDAVGCSIRVDVRGGQVMRILPRLNEDVNETWISDKARFSYDGLSVQRIDVPYVRKDGVLIEASWPEAIKAVCDAMLRAKRLGRKMGAIAGDMADCESMFALKGLMNAMGSGHIDCRQKGELVPCTDRAHYLFNSTISGIDEADLIMLVGVNPRIDAPIINARIRKRVSKGGVKVLNIGPSIDLTYKYTDLGVKVEVFDSIIGGSHKICNVLRQSKRPIMILGQDLFRRKDAMGIMARLSRIACDFGFVQDDWNGFNVLHRAAARVGGLDIGFVPGDGCADINELLHKSEDFGVLYLLAADEVDMSLISSDVVIYQGHHGDNGAHRADIVLPGCTYVEKDCTYVNTEGRPQVCRAAVTPPAMALPDWQIIYKISAELGVGLGYSSLSALRSKMMTLWPMGIGVVQRAQWVPFDSGTDLCDDPIEIERRSFFLTDSISRMSRNMIACAQAETRRRLAGQ